MSKETHRVLLEIPIDIIDISDEIAESRYQTRKKMFEQIIIEEITRYSKTNP